MQSRETFSKYIFELHELINRMLQKKSGLTYEQVRERYEHFRSRCGKNKTMKRKTKKEKRETKQAFDNSDFKYRPKIIY